MTIFAKSLIIASLAALTMPLTAQAQFSSSTSPIDATADDIANKAGVTILSGQVDVRQGQTRILADTMKIYGGAAGAAAANGSISRIEADGNFYYITPEQELRGNQGVYTKDTETFTVTGDVILLQGENVVSGDSLFYNLTTQEARVLGTCKGRRCGSNGRVKILLNNAGAVGPT